MKITVLGRNGFIGSALTKRLQNDGHNVYSYLRPGVEIVYLFNAPSSQILFRYAPSYCMEETVHGFINTLNFCKEHNCKLIYPSTLSKNNEYAACKLVLEKLHSESLYTNILGVRIGAGYGPNEGHKGEYASVVYQFCKQMKNRKRPQVFGDGTQTRDFIYIDDIVQNIIKNSTNTGIVEIGSGINTSTNELIDIINTELQTSISPLYVDKPAGYVTEAPCKTPCKIEYSLREGVSKVLHEL